LDLSKKIPAYLTEKQNIIKLILFTAAFALIFINIYSPFNMELFYKVTRLRFFLYSSGVILTGVLVVVISRIIMYQLVKRGTELFIYQYIAWSVAEALCMALFYTFYELVIIHDSRPFTEVFKTSASNTALVLLLPYSVLWLYFSWGDKKNKLIELSEAADPVNQKAMIPFRDEKGTLRLSLKRSDILYLQGTDNYVTIWYNTQYKVSKYLLRNTLKKLEDELVDDSIIRCHRSYLVNMEKVKLIRKEKEGMMIELESNTPVSVPVSRSYMNQVLLAFGQNQ
jgi:DNA-binding LytR/AlgR family response regulator